ncbi:flagellar biosynthetic protein FliO [Dethiosulfatarculus sandiegensis]|uniref:Flagellar protein n=1 Tax=Dethiosulfatarculus sandiegensis TaxID=1429043 RepID=A0A0D2JCP7_9BACT|nr:flagellar biosynthetic protein FliO [Dethiosulfatarculus sandiegensis]KIX13516.1 hypothetical protein X474_13605 [Dethiosulfatarculus sandiegensis]
MSRALAVISVALIILASACPALAGQEDAANDLAQGDFSLALLNMVAGLALVLGIMLLLFWAAKRFLPSGFTGGAAGMRIISRLPLGPRKFLALVKVGDKVLVLGVSPDRINLLTTFEDSEEFNMLLKEKGAGLAFGEIFKKAKAKKEEGN